MSEKRQRVADVRVGVFVALGVTATLAALFLVGQERRLWESTADLRAQFSNVGGLKVGGAVRLAGVNIGIVSRIDLPALDPQADEAVVSSIELGNVKLDAPSGTAFTVGKGKTLTLDRAALALPLNKTEFKSPINLALIAHDADEKLEVSIEAEGTNLHGEPAKERILVRLRALEGVSVGKVYFKTLSKVTVRVIKDNDVVDDVKAPTIQIGDGSTRKLNAILRVSEQFLERIRTDSQASVVGEGLLGDKYIDITIGSVSKPMVNDGDLLLANDAVDFTAALASTGEIIDDVNASMDSIRVVLDGFRKAGGEATVVAAVQSIQDIAHEIESGQGLVHQLIFDKGAGGDYKDIVANVKTATSKLDQNLARVDSLLAEVKTNKSLVHELLYGAQGEATITDARALIAEASALVGDVRTKPSFVHNLLYEKDRGDILANANAASADIKAITSDVKVLVADARKGKGTLGALMVDPSVYEDIKILLGNVRRNDAVKALVRYSVQQGDKAGAQVPNKAASTPTTTP